MLAPRCRSFTVLDAMLLVAATAVAIVWMKSQEHSPIHQGLGIFASYVKMVCDPFSIPTR